MEARGINLAMIDKAFRHLIENPVVRHPRNKRLVELDLARFDLPITWVEAPWIQFWTDEDLSNVEVPEEHRVTHELWAKFQNDYDFVFRDYKTTHLSHIDYNFDYSEPASPTTPPQHTRCSRK